MKFPSWPTVKSSAAVELVAEEVGECPVTSVADFRGYFMSDRREKSGLPNDWKVGGSTPACPSLPPSPSARRYAECWMLVGGGAVWRASVRLPPGACSTCSFPAAVWMWCEWFRGSMVKRFECLEKRCANPLHHYWKLIIDFLLFNCALAL